MSTATTTNLKSDAERPNEEAAEKPAPVKAKAKRRGAKAYLILAVVVVVGLLGYVGFRALTYGKENTDDAQVEADIVPISARVAGMVIAVHVKDNQSVKKGDAILEIDPHDYEVKVHQKEAELAAAKAQSDAADAQVRIVAATSKGGLSAARAALSGSTTSVGSASAQVAAAKAAVSRAEAEQARADSDLERAESLRKDQAIPQAQVDTARSNALAARAAVAQARAQLAMAEDAKRTAQTRVSESRARVEQSAPVDAKLAAAAANAELAHAHVASAEAQLADAKLKLSYTHVVAPADGVLSKLAVHEGQLVSAAQQVVAVVPDATYVVANFKETQVGAMRPGQRAVLSVDAFPGRELTGQVVSTSPGTGARFSLLPPDNASGNFVKVVQRVPVKIAWTNLPPDVHVAAGMSVDATVYTK